MTIFTTWHTYNQLLYPSKVASSCGLSLVIIDDQEGQDDGRQAREDGSLTISQMEDAKSRGVLVINYIKNWRKYHQ